MWLTMLMVMKKIASDFPSIQQLTRKRCFALHRLSGRTAFSGIVVSPGIFGNNPTRHCFHDASLVNFTPSRCSCGPDNSTDIWLICVHPCWSSHSERMARFLRGEYAHPLHLDWPLALFTPLHANLPSGGRKCGDKCLTDRLAPSLT